MRYAIHFGNGQSDLIDTPALLIRGGGDFAHDIRDARNGIDDVSHGFPGAFHQHRTGIDTRDGIFNQRFYFFRRLGAAAGQITHLACHDRKTAPLLSRARRFYRRVQRQNVSLEGNTVDNADNVSDFFRTVGNFVHGVYYAVDHFAAMACGLGGALRQLRSLTGVIGVLLHGGRQLFHAGSRLLQSGGLLFGTGREVGITGGNFTGAGINRIRTFTNLRYGVNQRALHMFNRSRQFANFITS